jgi:hypothetical protein
VLLAPCVKCRPLSQEAPLNGSSLCIVLLAAHTTPLPAPIPHSVYTSTSVSGFPTFLPLLAYFLHIFLSLPSRIHYNYMLQPLHVFLLISATRLSGLCNSFLSLSVLPPLNPLAPSSQFPLLPHISYILVRSTHRHMGHAVT